MDKANIEKHLEMIACYLRDLRGGPNSPILNEILITNSLESIVTILREMNQPLKESVNQKIFDEYQAELKTNKTFVSPCQQKDTPDVP